MGASTVSKMCPVAPKLKPGAVKNFISGRGSSGISEHFYA